MPDRTRLDAMAARIGAVTRDPMRITAPRASGPVAAA
jgi:hypothetical protein